MFGAIFFERDPLRYRDLPALLVSWIQDAGGFAMVAILVWLLFGYLRMRPVEKARIPGWMSSIFLWSVVGALLAYVAALVIWLVQVIQAGGIIMLDDAVAPADRKVGLVGWCLLAAGALALVAGCTSFVRGLFVLRFRWTDARAKLIFKEGFRSRLLYAFMCFLLLRLFGSWFITSKPED